MPHYVVSAGAPIKGNPPVYDTRCQTLDSARKRAIQECSKFADKYYTASKWNDLPLYVVSSIGVKTANGYSLVGIVALSKEHSDPQCHNTPYFWMKSWKKGEPLYSLKTNGEIYRRCN